MKSIAFGLSDVGRRRESNEDDFLLEPEGGLYAVADGMGGHAAGEVASQLAIDTLREALRRVDAAAHRTTDETERWLRSAVIEANRRICESIRLHEDRRGMGTTVVALVTGAGEEHVVGHVGDSRLYLLRGEELRRVTSDHSWVNEQVKLGLMSDDTAQRHPMRNIVTRALGSRAEVVVDIASVDVRPGDVFLLCSDGLNTMLSDDAIGGILERHRRDPEKACRALVESANASGGEDNVTVVVVSFEPGPAGRDSADDA